MASVQDLESRVRVMEDKLDFLMKSWRIKRTSLVHPHVPVEVSLLDLYRESQQDLLSEAEKS